MRFIKLVWLACGAGLGFISLGCAHFESISAGYRGPGALTLNVRQSSPARAELKARAKTPFLPSWPVTRVRINRGFQTASTPRHYGVDLGGAKGTPVYSSHPGTVIYVGSKFSGYGNMVMVEFDSEWASLYAHLDKTQVQIGQVVSPGDQIGTMGNTGRASGVHLHFELMRSRLPINPAVWLTAPPQKLVSR